MAIKPKIGFCINCDNRHGCKSKTPSCIEAMESDGIKGSSGKEYLLCRNRIHECRECPFFRSCWGMEEYDRRKGPTGR